MYVQVYNLIMGEAHASECFLHYENCCLYAIVILTLQRHAQRRSISMLHHASMALQKSRRTVQVKVSGYVPRHASKYEYVLYTVVNTYTATRAM